MLCEGKNTMQVPSQTGATLSYCPLDVQVIWEAPWSLYPGLQEYSIMVPKTVSLSLALTIPFNIPGGGSQSIAKTKMSI